MFKRRRSKKKAPTTEEHVQEVDRRLIVEERHLKRGEVQDRLLEERLHRIREAVQVIRREGHQQE